eukprot:TRINITY_DN1809_c0_g1_i1.p1 TRINITY_DN1809_c0_g1~~TRINITY_DN1809_c0_g1_i1.p1  ORF type:complete len:331 (+),score=73.88 TRINITY_DN1809_c0_g1_i1:115-1107(+)
MDQAWTLAGSVLLGLGFVWFTLPFFVLPTIYYLIFELCLSNPLFLFFVLFYFIFFYFGDSQAIQGRGKRWDLFMSTQNPLWSLLNSFFPMRLHATTPLKSTMNYMFCIHPNSLFPFHVSSLLLADSQWNSLFPFIQRRALASTFNFRLPLWREFLLWCGFIESSRESAMTALNNGQSLIIFPSVEESIEPITKMIPSHPQQHQHPSLVLFLQNKKGFIKFALQNGTSLVPCFAFGLTEAAQPLSLLVPLQKWLVENFNISLPLYWGYFFLIPRREAINVVVGAPIVLERNEDPTEDEVNEIQQLYVSKIAELFETFKSQFGYADHQLFIA